MKGITTKGSFIKICQVKCLLFIWLAGLFSMDAVIAQKALINVKTDTSAILIGDQIGFTLEADADNTYKVAFPQLSDSLTPNIRVVRRIQADTIMVGARYKIIHRYLITSFDSGLFEIPSFPFRIYNSNSADTLFSAPLALSVSYPPTDTIPTMFDIKAPLPAPYTLEDYLRIILPVLLAVLIILFLVKYVKRKKKYGDKKDKQEKPSEPAHVVALRELDRLKEEKLWQQGFIKDYYTRLTEIIRRYIERRFNVPAMEQTSTEILHSMKPFILEDDTLRALQELLSLADMVKFARELPMPDENESNMLNAYVFVNHTAEGNNSANVTANNLNEGV